MRYDFSHHFIRIVPPDTAFSQAWESLCAILLQAELGSGGLIRFSPPDYGIDILHRPMKRAYQCKSTAEGAGGTIDGKEAMSSLETASKHQNALGWALYAFATNAYFSGVGTERILLRAKELSLHPTVIEFLGPDYWDQLCCKHSELIEDRFEYKISAAEKKFLEALKRIGLHPKLEGLVALLENSELKVTLTNNLTQLEIELPLDPDLPVGRYIDLISTLLKFSSEWINFRDAQGSMLPKMSLRLNGREVPLGATLGGLGYVVGDQVELHVEAMTRKDQALRGLTERELCQRLGIADGVIDRISVTAMSSTDAGPLERRATAILQAMLWMGVRFMLEAVGRKAESDVAA